MKFRRSLLLALVAVLVHPAPPPAARVPDACDAHPPWLLAADVASVLADASAVREPDGFRVVTYNLHSGLGRHHSFYRPRAVVEAHLRSIAAAIAGPAGETPPDVVGLNEVDFGSRRSGGIDQAAFVADALGALTHARYEVIRGETWARRLPGFEVRFGNAVLTRHPIVRASACLLDGSDACAELGTADRLDGIVDLPALRSRGWLDRLLHEARGVIALTLDVTPPGSSGPRSLDVLVTHLDALVQSEREAQAAWLLARFVAPGRTTVLLGDVNAVPTVLTGGRRFFAADRTHDVLTSGALADARFLYAAARGIDTLAAWATFPSDRPIWPLDAILATLDLVPHDVAAIGDPDASDHRGFAVRYAFGDDAAQLAERARHDAIRRRQAARIATCDLAGARAGARGWLLRATGFAQLLAAPIRGAVEG